MASGLASMSFTVIPLEGLSSFSFCILCMPPVGDFSKIDSFKINGFVYTSKPSPTVASGGARLSKEVGVRSRAVIDVTGSGIYSMLRPSSVTLCPLSNKDLFIAFIGFKSFVTLPVVTSSPVT